MWITSHPQIADLDDSKSQIWTTADRRSGHAHVRKSRMWTCARPQIADVDDSKSQIWTTANRRSGHAHVRKSRMWICARPQIADVDMRTSANRGSGRQQIYYLDNCTTAKPLCGCYDNRDLPGHHKGRAICTGMSCGLCVMSQ